MPAKPTIPCGFVRSGHNLQAFFKKNAPASQVRFVDPSQGCGALADPDSVAGVAAKGVRFIDIKDAESGGFQMEVWRTHYLEGVPEEVGQRMVSIKRHSKPAARFQQLQS